MNIFLIVNAKFLQDFRSQSFSFEAFKRELKDKGKLLVKITCFIKF